MVSYSCPRPLVTLPSASSSRALELRLRRALPSRDRGKARSAARSCPPIHYILWFGFGATTTCSGFPGSEIFRMVSAIRIWFLRNWGI